jgi:hypothetical protein
LGGKLTKCLGKVEAGRLLSKIVKVQVAFRASHASKARRYFAKDNPFVKPLNTFGVVDNTTYGTSDRKSLGDIFFTQLNERVDEPHKISSFFERIPDSEAIYNVLGSNWIAWHSFESSFD